MADNHIISIMDKTHVLLPDVHTAISLYLKLINVGDFKKTEEVMSTKYQYSFNLITNTACLFWPGGYSGAPNGIYVHSDTWLEGSPPQIS